MARISSLESGLTQETTHLGRLTKFFLTKRDQFFSLATEIRNQLIQIVAAGTSWGVFYGSAKKYAESQSAGEGVLYVASTTVAATVFTYVVSDEFFTKNQNKVARKLKKMEEEKEAIPSEQDITDITRTIKIPTTIERRLTDTYITLGACGASWPFTFVGLQYSSLKMLWFLIAYGVVLQIDNTVLHFLAIYLAFNHKGYGFLRIAWNELARWISLLKIKDDGLLTLRLIEEQKSSDYLELMDILAQKLTQSRQNLIERCLTSTGRSYEISHLELLDFDQSLNSGLEDLLSLVQMNPNHATTVPLNHSYVDKMVHVVGAIETDLSYLGYIVGLFRSVLDVSEKWNKGLRGLFVFAAGVVPNYFFITLMSYVGGGSAERFFNYVVDCVKNKRISLSPEIKLHLRTFYPYALLAIPITWYSPGSAPQINEDNLPEPYAHPLAVNSQYGVRFLIAIIFVDFFVVVARKIMIYGKNSEAKDFFRFLQCYDDKIDTLKLVKPVALEQDMKILTSQQKMTLFGIDELALDEKLDHKTNLLNKLKKEISSSRLPPGLYATFFSYQIRARTQLESGSFLGSGQQIPLLGSTQFDYSSQ